MILLVKLLKIVSGFGFIGTVDSFNEKKVKEESPSFVETPDRRTGW